MTSDAYKEAFEGQNGDEFRQRVSELENAPRTATRPRGNVRGEEATTPTPGMTSFDPSFDDQPAAAPAAAAPAQPASQPVATTPGQLLVWEYQPTDAQNRPLGGVQRFKYDPTLPATDPKSLASQLTKSNIHVRRMANERKIEAIIDSVKTVATGYSEPTFLTPEQHPNADAINELTRNAIVNGTLSAMNVFKQNHPEFVLGEANAVAMTRWVEKSGRSPADAQTWELAFKALKPHLATVEVAAEPVAVEPVVEVPAPAPAVRRANGVPTGISNADTFNEEPIAVAAKVQGVRIVLDGKTQIVDLRTWDRIPSDVQKRALRNQSNASAIDSLYRAADERRAAARGARG
jgi:hypothetical protein